MVKEKKIVVATPDELARITAENEALHNRIAELEAKNQETFTDDKFGVSLAEEIRRIKVKGKSQVNTIVVREKIDHVNISLWTQYGKRVGPMHPDNAIQALERFSNIGIRLSATQPSQAQVDAFWNSPEGKKMTKAWTDKQEWRRQSRKTGQMEKMVAEIAKISGMQADAINNIVKANEMKSPAEGRKLMK